LDATQCPEGCGGGGGEEEEEARLENEREESIRRQSFSTPGSLGYYEDTFYIATGRNRKLVKSDSIVEEHVGNFFAHWIGVCVCVCARART